MKRFTFLLLILQLFAFILHPSRNVIAINNIESQEIGKAITSTSFQLSNLSQNNALDLVPQPTPAVPQVNSTAPNPRVFIPMVSNMRPTYNYYVSPSGSDSNPGTYNKPWHTIQKAANTLVAGQSVKILPGTYYEKFSPARSGNATGYITYTADPGTVILDGSGVSMSTDNRGDGLVQIQGKSYIKVQNLTLRNSSANCVNISDNTSGTRSSYIEISSLTIQNCNKVGIRTRSTDQLLIKDNLINHINYSSGIGVWWSNDVTVDNNTITNAHYYHECQGAYDEALTIASTNRFEVKNNTLDNTEANPAGFCENSEKLGINVKESSQNGLVHHNKVRHMNAAAIYVDAWHAGSNGTPTLNHINIYQNRVENSSGITVGCEQSDGVVEYINIYNNVLLNASYAGIQIRGAYGDGLRKNINIYNNTIYGALPEGGNGGAGIYITTANLGSNNGDAPVIIRNNVSMFYFLSSGSGTLGQILVGNATIAAKITADHNLVNGPQKCSYDYPGCVEVGNRISANPATVFTNPSGFDLHLKSGSPAIDAGISVSTVPVDFDNLKRPQPDGRLYDIGAFEYKP